MKTLIISAFAAAVLATAASTANAFGQCPPWTCTSNGTQLTGIALGRLEATASCPPAACMTNGTQPRGLRLGTVSARPVGAVVLPSGETVDLR